MDKVEEALGCLGDVAGLEQEHRALLPILPTLPSAGIAVWLCAHLGQTDAHSTPLRPKEGGQEGERDALVGR